jgi:hypothetical protein
MIKLEEKFVSGVDGFSTDPLTYTQLARTETTAIYERSRNGIAKDFEVFRIKILPKGTKVFQTVTEDDQEKYPGASQFGFNAWTFNNKAYAMQRFEELGKEKSAEAKAEAKEEERKALTIPVGDFTVGEFAEKNGMTYANAFIFVKGAVEKGSVKFLREERRAAKGKPSKIYAKA